MPVDAKGNTLKSGDKVLIPGTVESLSDHADGCNVAIETEYVMPGFGHRTILAPVNTAQVYLDAAASQISESVPAADLMPQTVSPNDAETQA